MTVQRHYRLVDSEYQSNGEAGGAWFAKVQQITQSVNSGWVDTDDEPEEIMILIPEGAKDDWFDQYTKEPEPGDRVNGPIDIIREVDPKIAEDIERYGR